MQTDRFQGNVSRKLDWNEALNTVGSTISNVFGKPDTYNTYNTTVEEGNDNTMLYVGIGGAALLVVVLLIVFMK
ncbi:MAG: hypothetical protein IKY27_08600 [Bacteroidales bacterium]|nr:hypothetical protein [Bacteroidales bacterium]